MRPRLSALCAIAVGMLAVLAPAAAPRAEVVALPAYNVDRQESSVSGLSSGGYMAVQFHVAFSSILKGVGVVAGGPYNCAQGNLTTALTICMNALPSPPNPQTAIATTHTRAQAGTIDPVASLASQKVYVFSGTQDVTVRPPVMNALNTYYRAFVDGANVAYVNGLNAGHAMPTDRYGNPCPSTADPWINQCDYDAAGVLLQHIYGPLNPRNDGPLSGTFLEFDQGEFIANPPSKSMDTSGWAYVPQTCAEGAPCRVHVVFHGCQQYSRRLGDTFVRNSGYNAWADTNHLIVLYPQTINSFFNPLNPNGCWDWWGYNNPADYDIQSGAQMLAVRLMIERVASGHVALPPPTGLVVTGVTDTNVSLAWNAVAGAAGYNVYRDGVQVNATLVTTTTYTDTGLRPGTTYTYYVRAVASGGGQSAPSDPVSATTTGTPPPIDPPTDVSVGSPTGSTLTVSWTAAPGAIGYNVYRSFVSGGPYARVNPILVTTTSYVDRSLAERTTYYYVVRAVDASQNESANSNEASGTTTSGWTCTTTYASNYAHTVAGRAYPLFGYAYAVGSDQFMGLWNVFVYTTLAQTAPGYFVVGNCP